MTVESTRLPNGLTVASDAMAGLETTAVGVWVSAGSRYEAADLNGAAHMLEHMAFKGTKRRSALRIAEEIEDVGGHMDAYTTREQTAYVARVLKNDLPLAVDMLGDILQHSVFAHDELARERTVVLQEIGEVNDTPDDIIFDHLQSVAFPDQALGRTILGPPERVSTFSREDLLRYMDAHYLGPRMVVSAAGAVNHDELVALVADKFGGLRTGNGEGREAARYVGGETRERRELEQTHLIMGFESVPYGHDDYFVTQIFSTILGGGMSSRLFQEVREKRGLAYTIFTFAHSYLDCGMFGVYTGTSGKDMPEAAKVIADEVQGIAGTISEAEIVRARAQHKAAIMMALESSSSRCEHLARQLLIYGRSMPTSEVMSRIDAVDQTALARVASRIGKSKLSLAALGLVGKLEGFDKLAQRFQ
ncbi:MAG: insulinase family protein [Alphaproteobacteria bacterium]|nr:insulinase family protein [Alphaproteobacteria bacterium]